MNSMGRLRYWDVACPHMTSGSPCPDDDDCVFAHSRDEISYHPAKFKTRRPPAYSRQRCCC